MAYRPAGYLEDDEEGHGEAGFYFGDEEELESFQPNFQVDVTVTSSSSPREISQHVGKDECPCHTDEPPVENRRASVRICTCADSSSGDSVSVCTEVGESLTSKSSEVVQNPEWESIDDHTSQSKVERSSPEGAAEVVSKVTKTSSESGVCIEEVEHFSEISELGAEEAVTHRKSTLLPESDEVLKFAKLVSEESKYVKSSTGLGGSAFRSHPSQTGESVVSLNTKSGKTGGSKGESDKSFLKSYGIKADIKVAISRGNEAAVLQLLNNGMYLEG